MHECGVNPGVVGKTSVSTLMRHTSSYMPINLTLVQRAVNMASAAYQNGKEARAHSNASDSPHGIHLDCITRCSTIFSSLIRNNVL